MAALHRLFLTSVLLGGMAGCGQVDAPARESAVLSTLTVGFGLTSGESAQTGIQQAVRNISLEGLVAMGRDGRLQPWLAEKWSNSPDGLTWRFWLRPGVTFHDGQSVTAEVLRGILRNRLPQELGPGFEDVAFIRAVSDHEIEISLRRRSAFLLESLGFPIESSGGSATGTGPFYAKRQFAEGVEMLANEQYYLGRAPIDRIVIKAYATVRSAWADMLRGRLDMLYEVGADAVDLLETASESNVFAFLRHYVSVVVLNTQKPYLRSGAVRRALNAAIDRDALVDDALHGYGRPADGPVWPLHWAYDPGLPRFRYEPRSAVREAGAIRLRILYAEPSHERLALTIQRQLRAAGVDVTLETASLDQALDRIAKGDFDGFLADVVGGPTLVRPFLFWHSRAPRNVGRFRSERVDAAFDAIRYAKDDRAYKAGVAAFQGAIVDDPPAIFLAWSQRARAVSTRFDVPVEPGRDILSTLRLWRPAADPRLASPN